ncbi:MAG: 2-dehydro-3-deoxygalactonokinase [Pseudoxanthomonas sp.]
MIAVDWGTSSLRAFRLDAAGVVLESRRSDQGAMKSQGCFGAVLAGIVEGWDDGLVIMSGMVGSRQGWKEVGYVECPVDAARIAAHLQPMPAGTLPGREIWLVPGLSAFDRDRVPDVMRGEETQVCGLLAQLGEGAHYVCLPGTHSKHVRLVDGRIDGFSTLMTGELFDLLRNHSLLGRLMEDGPLDAHAFAEGVAMAARPAGLLQQLFTVRSRALFDQFGPRQVPGYLSGLLIGHELRAVPDDVRHVHVVSADGLAAPYLEALRLRGLTATHHHEDAAAKGMHLLAGLRGLAPVRSRGAGP